MFDSTVTTTSCPECRVIAVDARLIGEEASMTPALAGA